MKLTIHIEEHKSAFFLELLNSFEDFITVETVAETHPTELSEAHKALLDARLASYERNPDNVLDWEAVQKELEQTL